MPNDIDIVPRISPGPTASRSVLLVRAITGSFGDRNFLKNYLVLASLCPHCCTWPLSLVEANWSYSLIVTRASRCRGFSCCGAQAVGCLGFKQLKHVGSVAVAYRLSCPTDVGSSGPETELVSTALADGFLTTRPSGKLG